MPVRLRLDRESLSDLTTDDLAVVRGADGGPTRTGCPWTGEPCLFTGTPPTFRVCS